MNDECGLNFAPQQKEHVVNTFSMLCLIGWSKKGPAQELRTLPRDRKCSVKLNTHYYHHHHYPHPHHHHHHHHTITVIITIIITLTLTLTIITTITTSTTIITIILIQLCIIL